MVSSWNWYQYSMMIFYFSISLPIFNQIYETSKQVIDEEFHLRQGLHYCEGNFSVWDPKITTFPGLYLASLPLNILKACSDYNLRLINLLASVVNVYLIFEIRHNNYEFSKTSISPYSALETLTLTLLPPMYFFAHLYYTDVLSITTILAMLLFSLKGRYQISSLFAVFSILMRQTNIVWIGATFGINVLNLVMSRHFRQLYATKNDNSYHTHFVHYDLHDFQTVLNEHLQSLGQIQKSLALVTNQLYGFVIVILSFILFVLWNGSIVVGDKSAHQATLHFTQVLYFSLFNLVFGISTTLENLSHIVKFLRRRWFLIIPSAFLLAGVIKYYTLVHPYLLADNRHYIFYIWNRFYGRYEWAKYIMIPIYIVALTNIFIKLRAKSFGFSLLYVASLIVSVSLQLLLEVRYFLIPFLFLRLQTLKPKTNYLVFEFLCYLGINAATLYLFYTKEIYWSDYKDVQRIIW